MCQRSDYVEKSGEFSFNHFSLGQWDWALPILGLPELRMRSPFWRKVHRILSEPFPFLWVKATHIHDTHSRFSFLHPPINQYSLRG